MREKPNLEDEKIIAHVRDAYGIPVADIEFLPIGNDSRSWVYRVDTDKKAYFLKVRGGAPYEPSVLIPRYLKDQGLEQVVAPLPTASGEIWQRVEDFSLILYPFLEASTGMDIGLSDSQWIEFGAILKRIHTIQLPAGLLGRLQKETFIPVWGEGVRRLDTKIEVSSFDHNPEKELVSFWRDKREEITQLVRRTEALGRLLQARSLDFVLCHSDIHIANLLIDQVGKLFIVDWDQPIFAPKERDLMFLIGVGAGGGVSAGVRGESLFFTGYAQKEEAVIDPLALAYYRYDWAVQEIGEYADLALFKSAVGEETKLSAVQSFRGLFDSGDVIESAYQSEANLPRGS